MATKLMPRVGADGPPRSSRLDIRYLLYFYLHAIGFVATTLLITWGLFVLLLLAIGDFSLDGLMHQLNNLTSRYVLADPARIASFKTSILVGQLFLAAAVMFFRRHHVLPQKQEGEGGSHG